MKQILALRGKSNLGKSQTIRTVVEMLTGKHPDASIGHSRTTKVDVRAVLNINGLKIGVESHGSRLTKENLDFFVRTGCDVIVCAARSRGATVDAVNALQGFEVQWFEQVEQSKPTEQVLRSIAMARTISQEVEALIGSSEPVPARTFAARA